jgi:integrase
MRTERNRDGSWNVWMSREEYREIPRYAPSTKAELAIRLMGDSGLRVSETRSVTYGDVKRTKEGRHYLLRVRRGKDTTGEYDGGKYRETWLPPDLERDLYRYYDERALDEQDPFVDREKRTVQYWVEQAAGRAAEETGDSDFEKVSTHDLRRCWANYLLVEQGVSPRIVMALGGWNSYDAIEPYLAAPTEENIIAQMEKLRL